jgi:hypothetical protein
MAEIWFNDTFFNISTQSNRRKFITAEKLPVDLGDDGSTPISAVPLIYLKAGDEVNSGDGGNFTVNGALTACADSP